jgi:hypothetical protein
MDLTLSGSFLRPYLANSAPAYSMICQEAFMASDWAASFSANKREHHGTLASTGTDPQALTLFLQPFRLGCWSWRFFPWIATCTGIGN